MELDERVKYWVDISDYDLETAKAMLETKRFLYVGFMCHQTIEKILKAYFVFKTNEQPPYIHTLDRLAKISGLFEELSSEQKEFIRSIEPLNIESRYPVYKEKIYKALTADKCSELISKTKEFSEWTKKKLSL